MITSRTSRTLAVAGVVAAAALTISGCSSTPTPASNAAALTVGSVDLSGVCPATITIQTDWNPESEHGHLYEMFGDDAVIDSDAKSVSGALYSAGEYTGVSLEVRAGGPAIGYQSVSSQMYQDDSITLGYISTDEAIRGSVDTPTTAVFAPLDISPLMIMWDPETYPDVTTIAELADSGANIRYFGGAAYMDYLVGANVIPEAQADGSFDGTPAAFIAADGKDGQQGYATSDPIIYGTELENWAKPVAYQLINDAGFPYYQSAISVRSGELADLSGCLTALVPVLQQAEVDFFADPAATTALILQAVSEYDNGWVYTDVDAQYSVESMIADGIVSNGVDGAIGDFDESRVQEMIDLTTPIFASVGITVADGLTPADIATNEFLDSSIALP